MKLTFTEAGWADYLWFQQNDKKLLNKINTLIICQVLKDFNKRDRNKFKNSN